MIQKSIRYQLLKTTDIMEIGWSKNSMEQRNVQMTIYLRDGNKYTMVKSRAYAEEVAEYLKWVVREY